MTRKVIDIDPRPRGSARGRRTETAGMRATGRGGRLVRFTVELDEDLHRRLRLAAARDGRRMAAIVRDLIEEACPE
ncbi:MAG: hypothetical protein OXQ84_10825 [bacterium]|nr:hypothetical protein [bacterium]